jgi:hypothetical protein
MRKASKVYPWTQEMTQREAANLLFVSLAATTGELGTGGLVRHNVEQPNAEGRGVNGNTRGTGISCSLEGGTLA